VQVTVAQKLDIPRRISAIGSVQALCMMSGKSQVDGMISEVSVPALNHVARAALPWLADWLCRGSSRSPSRRRSPFI
jgi:hypothetical protein